MNFPRTFILRSLRFHARSHVGTVLGVMVATAVLVGALAVGDSVRESLLALNLERIGQTDYALAGKDRLFRADLALDMTDQGASVYGVPVLLLPGTAANPDASARANHVQIIGVDQRFWGIAPSPSSLKIDGVTVNAALAEQLRIKPGDSILLRMHKPSLVSGEAPISPREQTTASLRVPVAGVVHEDRFGGFNLRATQTRPLNVFVPIGMLQAAIEAPGKANLLLINAPNWNMPALTARLQKRWKLADAELSISNVPSGAELRSDRVFIDAPVVDEVLKTAPDAQLVSTYFVNELRVREHSTPYSMVAGIGAPIVPAGMADDEIVINKWLADDLGAEPGDEVKLTYLVLGNGQKLSEKKDRFKIRSVVPLEGAAADKTLMPDFPGIAKAEKTENWDAGFAIDMKKIRPKDEEYWKNYRGTPKAFVTLKAAQRMWGNRFGDYTSIRFPTNEVAAVTAAIGKNLDPAAIGLAFEPVRKRAVNAASQGQDFGQLFLAFSFFLIVAALILMALLFQFGLEQRTTETGTLLAIGWRMSLVRRALLAEALLVALIGALLGVVAGLAYAQGILYGLKTIWRGAVASSALQFHASVGTLVIGLFASEVIAGVVIWAVISRRVKRPARELLERGSENEIIDLRPKLRRWVLVTAVCVASALALIAFATTQRSGAAVETFFGSGALLLIAGLTGAMVWLRRLAVSHRATLSSASLAARACARRRKRSVATIALLACGSFLIVAVEANKLSGTTERGRSSGTGGFALIAESSLPIVQDLNSKQGRDFFGLDEKLMRDVRIVPLRVRDGDDASCLNLNHPQMPRILGVNADKLQQLQAFSFSKGTKPSWSSLHLSHGVPAVADENSLEWSLHKSVGDAVEYIDGRGRILSVRFVGALANSILQGSVIIDEGQFIEHFPDESGYRMFLIDAPSDRVDQVAAALSRGLEDRGLEVTSAAKRLDEFNTVQNTYLNTFQILGGLGLLLGTAGLGVVVLRNVLERRAELALFSAVGLRARVLRRLIVMEHGALLLVGLIIGIVAALVAIVPALRGPVQQVNYRELGVTLGLVFLSGLVWTWLAARIALRGELLKALRNE
jgi:putative ABC transport system permease protein